MYVIIYLETKAYQGLFGFLLPFDDSSITGLTKTEFCIQLVKIQKVHFLAMNNIYHNEYVKAH